MRDCNQLFTFFYLFNTIYKGVSLHLHARKVLLSRANKFLLEINNDFAIEDCFVAQGDIKMIRKVADTFVVEFNQAACKEYLSSL